jgi:8-oxo-dGTP pyrophosphatase MutT (NUDIX family)
MNSLLKRLAADALETLRAASLAEPPVDIHHDDFLLYPDLQGTVAIEAAVLIPVILRGGVASLLFTRRTETLSRHSGQVSFPGGRQDPTDLTPVETALRETMEETGIDPAFVTIAGYMPRYRTGTGFNVLPVVGLVSEGFALAPDPREVAEIFEVPLAFFLDPANLRQESRVLRGKPRQVYAYHPDTHYIWGATAAMLREFIARLAALESANTPA